jgi:hypothetical protein
MLYKDSKHLAYSTIMVDFETMPNIFPIKQNIFSKNLTSKMAVDRIFFSQFSNFPLLMVNIKHIFEHMKFQ